MESPEGWASAYSKFQKVYTPSRHWDSMAETGADEQSSYPDGTWIAIGGGAGMVLGASEGGIGAGIGLILGAGAGVAYEAIKSRTDQ